MTQLTDEQKAKVQEWIGAGLKLAEIQDRLAKEHDVHLTYMDARFLVDDLKVTPKDPQPEGKKPGAAAPEEDFGTGEPPIPDEAMAPEAPVSGKVSIVVDTITRPGAA